MKNNIKATKMQSAKKHPGKAKKSCVQTEKVSRKLKKPEDQLKHSLRDRSSRTRAANGTPATSGLTNTTFSWKPVSGQ